jgi:hypothetical protein
MNLIKCITFGLVFVLGFALLCPFIFLAGAALRPAKAGGAWGWDPVAFAKSPLCWLIVLIVFVAGFAWEFRRL